MKSEDVKLLVEFLHDPKVQEMLMKQSKRINYEALAQLIKEGWS